MAHSTGRRSPSHGDCNNFVNGLCRLYGAAINPNGPACPRFTPKITTKRNLGETSTHARWRGMMAQPYRPLMHPKMHRTMLRIREEGALMHQLEELERQLKEVMRKLKKLR